MIASIMHSGSGLGNQLHRYVAVRCLALEKNYEFSVVAPENFKGKSFMNLDMGKENGVKFFTAPTSGKVMPIETFGVWREEWNEKTPYYNPEFNFIEDNTIIDGEFQDERYFEHRLELINFWLATSVLDILPNGHKDTCVIGFRGGEFYTFPELGLPRDYYEEAIAQMKLLNPDMKFEVHTDDEVLAKQFFPDFKIVHDIGINWRSVRNAKYAIIANSSFYILPRLLAHYSYNAITIAPRYWARRNTKEWSMPQNYYKAFTYI